MGKKAKERLYTDTPPKFTPNKLIVNFLECVAARAKPRRGARAGNVAHIDFANFKIGRTRLKPYE